MRDLLHIVVAWALSEPGHVRLRDLLAWHLSTRSRRIHDLRCRWADRKGRPGWRPSDYR